MSVWKVSDHWRPFATFWCIEKTYFISRLIDCIVPILPRNLAGFFLTLRVCNVIFWNLPILICNFIPFLQAWYRDSPVRHPDRPVQNWDTMHDYLRSIVPTEDDRTIIIWEDFEGKPHWFLRGVDRPKSASIVVDSSYSWKKHQDSNIHWEF
jgi:hypothetical protein